MLTSNRLSYAKTHYPEPSLQKALAVVLVLCLVLWARASDSKTRVSTPFTELSELAEMQVLSNPVKAQKRWDSGDSIHKRQNVGRKEGLEKRGEEEIRRAA